MIERIIVASGGGASSPVFRHRLGPVGMAGRWPICVISTPSLPESREMAQFLERADQSTLLIIQRSVPNTATIRQLRRAFRAVIFDLDDAIYVVPPVLRLTAAEVLKRTGRFFVRGSTRSSSRRRRLINVLRLVDAAVVGNEILGEFVRRYSARVIEIPTIVEPVQMVPEVRPETPIISWVGLPANLAYLDLVRQPLRRLQSERNFVFRVISSSPWNDASIDVEFIRWSEEASRAALLSSTVGIAPLPDDIWTQGKCALRPIQYGGHALPTVASPVGVTERVVLDGKTGFLARTELEWYQHLTRLLTDRNLADLMGAAALAHIKEHYSSDLAVTRWSALIDSL